MLEKLFSQSAPGEYCFHSHRWHQLIRSGWYTESWSNNFALSASQLEKQHLRSCWYHGGGVGKGGTAVPFLARIRAHRKPCPWHLRESLSLPSGDLCFPFPLLPWRLFSLLFRHASWKHVGLKDCSLLAFFSFLDKHLCAVFVVSHPSGHTRRFLCNGR